MNIGSGVSENRILGKIYEPKLQGVTVCWRNWTRDHVSRLQHNQHDKYLLHIYSVEILLMMDSGPVRNT